MEIEKIIDNIIDENHYFFNASLKKTGYYNNFLSILTYLEKTLTTNKLNDLLVNKLQIKREVFNEKSFIQAACETTVTSYFANKYKDSFLYEPNVNPTNKSNVDCQFSDKDFIYNVEVKCPSFDAKETIDKINDSFKFTTIGRADKKEVYEEAMLDVSELLSKGLKMKGEKDKPIVKTKTMDNNLKDFLISANKKFNPNSKHNEVNILVVCGDDAEDMSEWYSYLFAPQGLFTKNSFYRVDNYNQVDIIIINNLYHRHHKFYKKKHLEYNWLLDASFILAFTNPFTSKVKKDAILNFQSIFPHYNAELINYLENLPGDIPIELRNILAIRLFIEEGLTKRNIVLF